MTNLLWLGLPEWTEVHSDNPHYRVFSRKCKADTLRISVTDQSSFQISGHGLFVGEIKDPHRLKALVELCADERGGWA